MLLGGLLCMGPAALVWSQSDGEIDTQKKQLEKIQKEIEKHRAKTTELKREETNVVRQLSNLDKEISLATKLVSELETQEQLLDAHIDSLRHNIAFEEQNLRYRQRRLAARLRQMYMQGPQYDLEVVLSSTNVAEASRRYKFLRMVAERDANLVDAVETKKADLEREQASLTEAMSEISVLKAERTRESDRLATNRQARVSVLKHIRSEKGKHSEAIDELQRAEEEMKDLIERLERQRLADDDGTLPSGEFGKLKGSLIRPVDGKITKKYGQDRHPKFGTVTFNNGVNIKAPAGAPIRAVARGKVEFVDWISGYGNCIILNHGDGYYTLYAHTAQIFVRTGQMVSKNEVIAEVGDSGSLNGYECHFEIRKSKQSLDPMQWFAK